MTALVPRTVCGSAKHDGSGAEERRRDPAAPPARSPAQPQHAATEAFLAEQGIAWTALRHGFYVSTLEIYVPAALKTGQLRLPDDGPVSWTSHADLAEVDAIALTQPGALDGSPRP